MEEDYEGSLNAELIGRLTGTNSKIDLNTRVQATRAMLDEIKELLIRSNKVIFDSYAEGSLGEGNPFTFTLKAMLKQAETGVQVETTLTATKRHKDKETKTIGNATPDMIDEIDE